MNTARTHSHSRRLLPAVAIATVAGLFLSACAGSAGQGDEGTAGQETGFAYQAPQEEVDQVLADLQPVELTFQPPGSSSEGILAQSSLQFQEEVERRSGGKIKLNMVWGQAIASYPEVVDALGDGRVDIAFALPIYSPSEYEALSTLSNISPALPSSPMVGDMVANASLLELAWGSEDILADFESKDVTPLSPVYFSPSGYIACSAEGGTTSDFAGRQVRVGSAAQVPVIESLEATASSLAFNEAFEALQRHTIDCSLGDLLSAFESGMLEVAPHITYSTERSMPRAPGSLLAGASFNDLPVAYQQVLFDSYTAMFAADVLATADGYPQIVETATQSGGGVEEYGKDTTEVIASVSDKLLVEATQTGYFGNDLDHEVPALVEKWQRKAAELGYQDGGTLSDVEDWHKPGSQDFTPFAEAIFEEVMLEHRPE